MPGSVATINFLDEHAQPQRVDDTPLPWSHTLVTDDPTLFADLLSQGDFLQHHLPHHGQRHRQEQRSSSNVNGYIACLDKSA